MTRRRWVDVGAVVALSAIAIAGIQALNPSRPVPPNVVAASFVMGPCLAAFAYGCLRLAFADRAKPHNDH